MIELSPAERRLLKAHAHGLHPVVMIGDKGLSDAVLRAIDANLTRHELIKVKVAGGDRVGREAILADICKAVGASPVQHIGRVLVLYRENPPVPAAKAPESGHSKPARATPARRAGSATRTRATPRKAGPSK